MWKVQGHEISAAMLHNLVLLLLTPTIIIKFLARGITILLESKKQFPANIIIIIVINIILSFSLTRRRGYEEDDETGEGKRPNSEQEFGMLCSI